MFGTAQPLLLSSPPFDVVVNLYAGLKRLLRRPPARKQEEVS